MKSTSRLISVCFFTILLITSACSVSKSPSPEKTGETGKKPTSQATIESKTVPDNRFSGIWNVEDSTAQFRIEVSKKNVAFSGQDRADQEVFEISNVNWDQSTLFARVRMPSTNHIIRVKLTIIDEKNILCVYSGDASGMATWQREN